jgi:hypothetical protein
LDKRTNRREPLVTVTIYVEGGGDNNDSITRCRQAFAEYCNKLVPANRRPKIVACGSRHQAFKRFRTDAGINAIDHISVLLVDSEGPVAPQTSPAVYLQARDGWQFAPLRNNQLFLMVQAMEAWFLADRMTLTAFYGRDFRTNALRGDERNIETIPKDDLESSLINAHELALQRANITKLDMRLLSSPRLTRSKSKQHPGTPRHFMNSCAPYNSGHS